MKRFSKKLSLELVSIALALLVFSFAFFVWRLSNGMTQVDFLKPFVETAFMAKTGKHLSLDHLSIGADGWDVPVGIEIDNAKVTDYEGATVATVKKISMEVSRHGLLAGKLYPITADIETPAVYVSETKAGTPPEAESKKTASESPLGALANPDKDSTLAHWEKITIRNGSVAIADPAGPRTLSTAIDAELARTAAGVTGALHGVSGTEAQPMNISGTLEINHGHRGAALLKTGPIMLSDLALLPSLSFLQNDSVPVDATVSVTLNDAVLIDARVDLNIGAGQVVDDKMPAPVTITGGKVELAYESNSRRVELKQLEINLDGPKISGSGHADLRDGKILADATATVSDLPIDRFGEFWPADVSVGGRRWVLENLSKGKVQSATAHIVASGPSDDLSMLDISSVDGSMSVSGATVKYFGELQEVKDASADIGFNLDSMTIHMTGGSADGIALKDGTIFIDGFENHEQTIKIDLDLSGGVASALDLIDHQPLNYAQKLHVKSGDFSGTADTRLQMAFPLISDVSIDQLNVTTQSDLHDVGLPNVVDHMDMKGLNGTLNVGMGGMELIGNGQLVDIPVAIDYRQSFEKNGPTIILFNSTLDNRQRGELGVDFSDRLAGPVFASGKYTTQGSSGTIDMALDMTPSTFAIDEIGYVKSPGQAGSAKFLIKLQDGKLNDIDPLEVKAPKFSASGAAHFDGDTGKLSSLTLTALKSDDTDMSVTVTPTNDGGSKIDVTGSEFDARRFLHKKREKQPEAAPEINPTKLEINVNLDTIKTSDTNGLTAVKGQLILLGHKWQRADFTATADGSPVFLSFLPDSSVMYPSYTLNAGTQDAGATLAGFALTNSVKGGVLTVKGAKPAPTEDDPNPALAGTVALSSFQLANAPAFARLFNLLSVSGFGTAISSSSIHFSSFKSKFEIDHEEVRIADGRLRGDALGLTLAGTVDRDAGTLNLYGTVVPAYGANRVLNSIPVLGPLLTGGDGQGVFAATYSITGPYENANVSLNPLSVFAPGVLRDFLFGTSDPDMDSQ